MESLISVIIPCYNHSHYLPTAIESVLQQSYSAVEIIVVDDGSKDDTAKVCQAYTQVNYVFQNNQGLSAARNTGIKHSKGKYLVFLDADDWLYPNALKSNLHYLEQNPQNAFVSGAHDKILVEENISKAVVREIPTNHYEYLLSHGNFIGVPAAVLYQRWVFEEFLFDTFLRACEDYDLYLKVSRRYPVAHHTGKVAAYRIHTSNMSSNIPMMLEYALVVLERQKTNLRTKAEKVAYKKGRNFWKRFYCNEYYKKIKAGTVKSSIKNWFYIFKHQPKYLLKYLKDKL
jgi:glycosyltransferase involved in cell wall biosynthesis